jgi:thiaminase
MPEQSGPFSREAWECIAGWRDAVETMPFIRALADGSLAVEAFSFYLAQDALYLGEFARALAAASQQASSSPAQSFFAGSAHVALEVESSLHRDWLTMHPTGVPVEASPITAAYTDHLLATCVRGPYPVIAAAVLPCYWLYAHIADVIVKRAGDLTNHPYARWIATYADTGFQESARTARALVDEAAAGVVDDTRRRMLVAFERSSMHEYLFFQQALDQPTWPTPPAAGSVRF